MILWMKSQDFLPPSPLSSQTLKKYFERLHGHAQTMTGEESTKVSVWYIIRQNSLDCTTGLELDCMHYWTGTGLTTSNPCIGISYEVWEGLQVSVS